MSQEGQFRQLLSNYQHQSHRTKRLRNKCQAMVDEINQSYDYPVPGRRRHKIELSEQLKQINTCLRQGDSLASLADDSVNQAKEVQALAAQANYLAQQRHLHDSRRALALAVGIAARHSDSYWVDIDIKFTHFYFGGANGSSGDDGHGHYVIENANGLSVYERNPDSRHGPHNVVRWFSPESPTL